MKTLARNRLRLPLLPLAVAAIVLSRYCIRDIHHDWLNLLPLLATLYVAYVVWAARGRDRHGRIGSHRWPWLRIIFLFALMLIAAEFLLRCLSYHRSLVYERQGDLLYTPLPNQEYVEKVSLTHSQINDYGLRGGPVSLAGKEIILCLGDSVTFGYGLDDRSTYPAQLQHYLEQSHPGRYAVLNAGVDAYPVALMRQKFLSLWNRGIHPDIVIVGYSFNEGGWIPQLSGATEARKKQIESTVKLKNFLHSIALCNLLVENWGRTYYDRIKKYAAPARPEVSRDEVLAAYRGYLQALYDELSAHHVQVVFALFAGYNRGAERYAPDSPFQTEFRAFAQGHAIKLIESEQALTPASTASPHIYFQDQCHMTERGARKFSEALANGFVR